MTRRSDLSSQPSPEFRGTWNSPEKHYFLERGAITSTEFVFLSVIDKYVTYRGEGCWATIGNLAKETGVKRRQATYMLKKLKRLGLVIQTKWKTVGNQKRCVLVTKYSPEQSIAHVQSIAPDMLVSLYERDCAPRGKKKRGDSNDSTQEKESSMRYLFKVEEKTSKTKPTKDALRLADLLRKLAKKKMWFISASKNNWGVPIQVLINQLGVETVEKRLQWYIANHPQKIRLKLRNGKEFKQHYNTVENLMDKDLETNPKVEISKDAKRIYSYLDNLHWPKGSKSDLLRIIQISLDRITKLWKRLAKRREKNRYADRVLDEINTVDNFLIRWFKEVNTRITHVSDWKGKLDNFAFAPDHRLFTEMGRAWMTEYSRDPNDWDKLMEKVA